MTSTLPATASLADLEAKIERGLATFVDVGTALLEIRDRALYTKEYGDFESYLVTRWGFRRAHAYRLMEAAGIVRELSPMGDTPLPTNERQVRELARIPDPVERAEVWERVVTEHGERVTAQHIREVVRPTPVSAPMAESRIADEERPIYDAPLLSVVDVDTGAVVSEPGDITEAAYRIADDAGKGELARLRYLRKLTETLSHIATLATRYEPADVAAFIDDDFLRLNIEVPIETATAWVARVRAEMPASLHVIQGGRS